MEQLARVTAVESFHGRRLRVTFSDGLVRELDLTPVLVGFLASIDDDRLFAEVTVDEVAGTIAWPGGIDLDPDVLHGNQTSASGASAVVLNEYWLHTTL